MSSSRTDLRSRAVVVALAVALGLLVQGCGATRQVRISLTSAGTAAAGQIEARPITSGGYRSVPVGTAVRQTALGIRTFADQHHGVALATITGELFAATSSDGGSRWTVASPVLFAPAANADEGVNQISLKGRDTYFAWGGGGSAVDVTTDGGRHWWQAFLGGAVLSVTANGGELAAVVQELGAHGATTLIYVSANGRRWTVARSLAVG